MDVARGLTHVARGLTQRLHELTLLTLQLAQQAELALTRCFATAAELQAAEAIIDQEITDNIALREQLDAEVASGVELRAQLALTRDVLAHEQLVSATLRSRRHESAIQNTHAHRDEKLRVRLILQACPARSVPARSVPTHVAFAAHAPTVLGRARQLDQVEAAQAAAASATVKMRMDAESLKLFESLMNAAEMQPPQQRHLRLLLQNQLAALRNAKRDEHGQPIKSGRVVWHVEVLRLCTDIYRASPGAYQHLWEGGFLCLPHPDTCRKRAATASVGSGQCRALYDSLKERLSGHPPHTHEMGRGVTRD